MDSSEELMFLQWFVVTFLQTLLITKNTSCHLLWENFYTFRYLRPLCRCLKVVYVWVILLVRHYKRQEANELANIKQLPLL